MAKKLKKYLVTTEKREITIMRNLTSQNNGFCEKCGRETESLNREVTATPDGAKSSPCSDVFGEHESSPSQVNETRVGELVAWQGFVEGD